VADQELAFLSHSEAQEIECKTEREFALRCLAVGCFLVHQVPVGESVIDFLVINPRRAQEGVLPQGRLVEVTLMSKSQKDVKNVRRHPKDKHKVRNTTGERKERQITAMKNSGYSWTILYKENIHQMLLGSRRLS